HDLLFQIRGSQRFQDRFSNLWVPSGGAYVSAPAPSWFSGGPLAALLVHGSSGSGLAQWDPSASPFLRADGTPNRAPLAAMVNLTWPHSASTPTVLRSEAFMSHGALRSHKVWRAKLQARVPNQRRTG